MERRAQRGTAGRADAAVERYLELLRAGGSDYPMALLARAGVDLSQPETVRAVSPSSTAWSTRLEDELQ